MAASERADLEHERLAEGFAAGADDRELQRAFASSRAGYEQALREWPENPAAQEGLRRLLTRMVEYELDAGNARQAALLMAELELPPEALVARVEQARAAEEAQREAEAELQAIRAEQRIRGSDWTRAIATLINGACVVSALLVVGYLSRGGKLVPTVAGDFGLLSVGLVVSLFVVWRFRKGVLDSARYRRLMLGLVVLNALLLVLAATALIAQTPFDALFRSQILCCVAMASALAVAGDRFMWLSASFALACWAAMGIAPHWQFEAVAAGWGANTFWTAWVVRPGQG